MGAFFGALLIVLIVGMSADLIVAELRRIADALEAMAYEDEDGSNQEEESAPEPPPNTSL